jgi:ribose 5-phosphate isomerase RpiB
MRIAVINETSSADRNADVMAALAGRGHDVVNVGMTLSGSQPELTYIHTSFLAAVLLNAGRADLVVGGCGTGQGFLNAVMQYPGVVCGHLLTPLDARLFAEINAGNCVSLMLNQAYGWASDVNLRLLFDAFFMAEPGRGYPAHRRESQAESRALLAALSRATHRTMAEVVAGVDVRVVLPALSYPGVLDLLDLPTLHDRALADAIRQRIS